MERHLNKSKYGCPANRFSSTGEPLPMLEGEESMERGQVVSMVQHDGHQAMVLIPASMQGTTP